MMPATFCLLGRLERRPAAFAANFGLVPAPSEIYGLPPGLELCALRCGRHDYPAFANPSLFGRKIHRYVTVSLHVVASEAVPSPGEPVDVGAVTALVVESAADIGTPSEEAELTVSAVRQLDPYGWLVKAREIRGPMVLTGWQPWRPNGNRRPRRITVRLAVANLLSQTSRCERLWLKALPPSRRHKPPQGPPSAAISDMQAEEDESDHEGVDRSSSDGQPGESGAADASA